MDTVSSLKERSRKLIDEGKLTEAFPLLKKLVQVAPNDENLWNYLACTALQLQRFDEAIEAYKQSIRISPQSDWAWIQLAKAFLEADRLAEAEKTLTKASSLNARSPWLWRYYAKLYRKQKNIPKEIESLEMIYKLDEANGQDLNRLGIAYYKHGNYAKAEQFYRLSAAKLEDAAPFFYMGLVFNNPDVSQDVDAADAYRRALALNPDYQYAKEQLEVTRQKLVPLANRAKAAARDLIQPAEYFQFYLSPFEALQIEPEKSADEFDVKAVQRAKKRLLQEIDLNDGKVSWLGDHSLDKSRALALENELYDNHKRFYHRAIFQNQKLLRFLMRGDINHFLYADDNFPKETIELLEKEPEFLYFLSKPFAQQYNLLLSRALERKMLPVVEVLFDGRRWVLPEDDDVCFEGANKQVNYLVNLLRAEVGREEKKKPSLQAWETFLNQHAFLEIFNLLPASFRSAKTDIVAELRSLVYNNHGYAGLLQSFLIPCILFNFKSTFKSTELNKYLEEDHKTIAEKIVEECKDEVNLAFGKKRSFQITKEGIRDGNRFLSASSINKMRWGITVIGYSGGEKYDYLFVITDDAGETIRVSWCAYNEDQRVANSTKHFNSIVQATLRYLTNAAIEKMQAILQRGHSVFIGPCTLTKEGIKFKTKGLFFKNNQFVEWPEVSTKLQNGQVIAYKTSQPKVAIAMSARGIDNAVLLPIITLIMQDKKP